MISEKAKSQIQIVQGDITKEDDTEIAIKTVAQWLENHADYAMQGIFCCFDARTEWVYRAKLKVE